MVGGFSYRRFFWSGASGKRWLARTMNQRETLRRLKKQLGVPARMRPSRVVCARAGILMAWTKPVTGKHWFWYRWFLISLHALERLSHD
jgi:hypothetical protein